MKIKWALNELRKQDNEPTRIQGQIDLESSLTKRSKSILAAGPVTIDGWIITEGEDAFIVDCNLRVALTVPSTRSLTPVDIDCRARLQETYLAPGREASQEDLDQDELVIQLDSQELDLQKPIEDSIILAIPTKVLTEEEEEKGIFPKGDDWEVMTEEGLKQQRKDQAQEDSPFAALKDLFPDEDEWSPYW